MLSKCTYCPLFHILSQKDQNLLRYTDLPSLPNSSSRCNLLPKGGGGEGGKQEGGGGDVDKVITDAFLGLH